MAPAGAVFYGVYDLLKHNHLEALERAGCSSPSIPSAYTLMYGALAGEGGPWTGRHGRLAHAVHEPTGR